MKVMNQEIKKQWVDALKSGEYKQSKKKLRTAEGKFCCLGVLCELHRKAHTEFVWENTDGKNCYLGSDMTLPSQVVEWAGMVSNNPIMPNSISLAQLNDSGETFETIAQQVDDKL